LGQNTKNTSEYWKDWFDNRAKNASSDYVLNRGTTVRYDELERAAERQFLKAVDPQPTDVVLDAGCGSGRNISLLSGLVKEIAAIDFSEQMLAKAHARVADEKLGNVKLMLGSVTQLQFPNDTFDKVICASVLQYLDDDDCETALREMFRVCKDGGTVVAHIKNGTSLYGLSKVLINMVKRIARKEVLPEYYRSRTWHERTIERLGGMISDFDSFGIFYFVPLPRSIVGPVLRAEIKLVKAKWLKKFGVNYKLTIRVSKHSASTVFLFASKIPPGSAAPSAPAQPSKLG